MHLIPPHDSGEGDHPKLAKRAKDGGRGAGRDVTHSLKGNHRTSRCLILLHRQRSFGSDTPSTILRAARYGWSPSPAIAGADKRQRSRDAFASEFCRTQAIPNSSLERREAGRRQAHHRVPHLSVWRAPLFSALSRLRGRAGRGARSPFGAPPRFPRHDSRLGSSQRFLEPPDANGRTLSGTSAASTSRSGIGPDGLMRKPPAAARNAANGNRPRSAFRSTLAKASFVERDVGNVSALETIVTSRLRYRDIPKIVIRGLDPRTHAGLPYIQHKVGRVTEGVTRRVEAAEYGTLL